MALTMKKFQKPPVTIPEGESSVEIEITPIDDDMVEGTEDVTLIDLEDASNYDVASD
jgi:hypothetical protein